MKKQEKIRSLFDDLGIKQNFDSYKKFVRSDNFFVNKPKKKTATKETIVANKGDTIVLSRMMSKSAFNEVEFLNLCFSGVTMVRTAFVFSDLRGCDFSKTVLKNCDFSFANLQNCNFSGSIMINCIFRHTYLRNTNFSGSDKLFCDFTHAEF